MNEAAADIVAIGFDARVGPQDRIAADMTAVRVMGPMKVAVVASASYFAQRSRPRTPDDLVRHNCVEYRRGHGLGIAHTIEALAEPFLRSGQLLRVLEDWTPTFEGLFLYYPGHRRVPTALRALIDMIGTAKGAEPSERVVENTSGAA